MLLLIIAAFIIWLLLIPKKIVLRARARAYCVRIKIGLSLLFDLIRIDRRVMIYLRKGRGITVKIGRKKERPIKKRNIKPKLSPGIIRKADVRSLRVKGKLGIKGYPCETVLLTGVLRTLASIAAALTDPEEASVGIEPEFAYGAFDVDIEGILKVIPGRLIIEMIKMKKKNKV